MHDRFLDQKLLYGSRSERFIRELLTNSGVFWLFDMLHKTSADGVTAYFSSLPHWILLIAGLIQAWFISRHEGNRLRWWYHFIAPGLYTLIDILWESPAAFFAEPYHIFYWIWAAMMAGAYHLETFFPSSSTILKSLLLVALLPMNYLLAEWDTARLSFYNYWFHDSGHLFILVATIVFGIILGITTIMRQRFERLLYDLANHFEQIASWSFEPAMIQQSYDNTDVLELQRIERTVLFMDVRGFTPWSEKHSPREVVDMVNQFYRVAEPIIKANEGFKIQMTGDEIMTRFYTPDKALGAATALQTAIGRTLGSYGLSAGIGFHTGEVIEGLLGSEHTRQYGIFGDTVNIAARLQGQAQANEIIISQASWKALKSVPEQALVEKRELKLKGKSESFHVYVLKPQPIAGA